MRWTEMRQKLVTSFSAVILEKPDPKLFEPPADFKRYESVSALTESVAVKCFPMIPRKRKAAVEAGRSAEFSRNAVEAF